MDQPVFWAVLLAVAVLGATTRLSGSGPLSPSRAVAVSVPALVVAALSALALVVHCAVMFFAPWTDAVPGGRIVGDAIRSLGETSRWAYAVPAALLVSALLRVWWPALLTLAVALVGVWITMYGSSALTTHLAWLATLIVVGVAISTALLGAPRPRRLDQGTPEKVIA